VVNAAGANTLFELYEKQGLRWDGGRYDAGKIAAFYQQMEAHGVHAHTLASAIEIGHPVNLPKALRALDVMQGVVRQADDESIMEHKAMVGRYGFGCEPASAASVAGAHQLVQEGVIGKDERVVCILTGHVLKDPDATVQYHTGLDMKAVQDKAPRRAVTGKLAMRPIPVPDDLDAIIAAIGAPPAGLRAPAPGPDPLAHLPVSEY
jgi:threonine synthase